MRPRSIPCAATSGRETCANWKTPSNAPSHWKLPTSCTWNFPRRRPKARAAAASAGGGLPESGGDVTLPEGVGMETYVAGIERSLLQSALNQSNGVQTKAADVLGISYRSFRHLMKKYGL